MEPVLQAPRQLRRCPCCSSRASLVPVFSFGENELFQQFPNLPGSWIRRVQEALQKMLSVALPLFYGRLGLLIPFRVPIHTVGELCISHPLPDGGLYPSSLVHESGIHPRCWLRTLSSLIP